MCSILVLIYFCWDWNASFCVLFRIFSDLTVLLFVIMFFFYLVHEPNFDNEWDKATGNIVQSQQYELFALSIYKFENSTLSEMWFFHPFFKTTLALPSFLYKLVWEKLEILHVVLVHILTFALVTSSNIKLRTIDDINRIVLNLNNVFRPIWPADDLISCVISVIT